MHTSPNDQERQIVPTVSRVTADTIIELVYDPIQRKTDLAVSRFGGLWNIEKEVRIESGEILVPYQVHQSVYDTITNKIVEAIKAGTDKFMMPWHSHDASTTMPVNAATNAEYRGINVLSLWIDAIQQNYPSGYWASYLQWQKLGARVRKGEHGSTIVFYKKLENDGSDQEVETKGRSCVARASRVFNAAQVEGWSPPIPQVYSKFQLDVIAESFVAATGARIRHGFSTAKYRRDLDDIEMPSPEWFTGTITSTARQSYYAILLHELTHNAEPSVMPRRSGFARKAWPDQRFHAA